MLRSCPFSAGSAQDTLPLRSIEIVTRVGTVTGARIRVMRNEQGKEGRVLEALAFLG